MMLRSLVHEVIRRHLWPIPLVALLVLVAAPLLFLKGTPESAPPAAAVPPPAAAAGVLPERAQRLLAANDGAAGVGEGHPRRSSKHDPFKPPASHDGRESGSADSAADSSGAAPGTSGAPAPAAGTRSDPIPVVVTNPGAEPETPQHDDAVVPPVSGDPDPISRATVDVRFGPQVDSPLRRGIARNQTFVAGGRIVAVFVKYSPRRRKAVFAIAPRTLVTGDVECRRKEGLCRYVDIPAGGHARLTMLSSDDAIISRRLDVVHVNSRRSAQGVTAASSSNAVPADAKCLLRKLLALGRDDAGLPASACERPRTRRTR